MRESGVQYQTQSASRPSLPKVINFSVLLLQKRSSLSGASPRHRPNPQEVNRENRPVLPPVQPLLTTNCTVLSLSTAMPDYTTLFKSSLLILPIFVLHQWKAPIEVTPLSDYPPKKRSIKTKSLLPACLLSKATACTDHICFCSPVSNSNQAQSIYGSMTNLEISLFVCHLCAPSRGP